MFFSIFSHFLAVFFIIENFKKINQKSTKNQEKSTKNQPKSTKTLQNH